MPQPMVGDEGGGVAPDETPTSQRLTNEDFRRLLMTPRSGGGAPPPSSRSAGPAKDAASMPPPLAASGEDRGELRRKKKSFYAALKKREDNKLAELAEKYRDRARERRDNSNPDYGLEQDGPAPNATNAYRAVAPDLKSGLDAKERRRRTIQESKFLGGDMEHTHLVKGLDYALLQKVRSEIHSREAERDPMPDGPEEPEPSPSAPAPAPLPDDELQFKTTLARDIFKTLAVYKSKHVERNEMFAPGRMAYVVDLEDDAAPGESDIPTTLIRSRAEAPAAAAGQQTLTTNDIVINKLAQVLSYLRHGARHGGKGRRNRERAAAKAADRPAAADDSIYGDIGDYAPARAADADRGKRRDGRDDPKKKGSYFDGPPETEKEDVAIPKMKNVSLLSKLAAEPEGYAECYPGLREMDDAIDDSDDEADYTKMDIGNKKGPIGRWDFDTQEEYSAYMNQREALPKAAFQYGVKTMDGRKTRKTNKEKNDKAELDREWQQIQNIIQKRKPKERSGDEPDFKVPKY